jgi:hypothetical protein
MSMTELREAYRTIPRARRREMMQVLQELEAEETAVPAKEGPLVSMEDAKAYLYKNCDGLLHRLAQ